MRRGARPLCVSRFKMPKYGVAAEQQGLEGDMDLSGDPSQVTGDINMSLTPSAPPGGGLGPNASPF